MADAPVLIDIQDACALTSLSRTYINKLRAAGAFPREVHIGDRRIAFVRSEVEAWILERIAERDAYAAARGEAA